MRVLRYRRSRPDGSACEAYWLTDWPTAQIGPRSLLAVAKSRWEIENQGFNDAKSRHGLEHVYHHHPASLLIGWLLVMLGLTLERLYRERYLHRGTHRPRKMCRLPNPAVTPPNRMAIQRLGRLSGDRFRNC